MSIRSAVGRMLRGKASPTPSITPTPTSRLTFDAWAGYIAAGRERIMPTINQLERSYSESSIVRACIDELITAIAPLEITAPIYQAALLERPNPQQDQRGFLARLLILLLTTGEAYVWKVRTGAAVTALVTPQTSRVLAQEGRTWAQPVLYYEILLTAGERLQVGVEDIVRIRDESVESLFGASSRIAACWPEVELDAQRSAYQTDTLRNLAQASLVAETERPTTAGQRKDLRESILDEVGARRRGGVMVLPAGVKLTSPGALEDLDMPGIGSLCESRISACLNVPAILVGLRAGLERSTYSNYEEARKSFYQETVEPLAAQLSQALTRGLIADEGMSGEIEIVVPEIEEPEEVQYEPGTEVPPDAGVREERGGDRSAR